jgi:AraC-like DNA-binding protein
MTGTTIKDKQPGIAERFAGIGSRVTNTVGVPVSNTVHAECLEMILPEEDLPEDRGMLYLYPIGDDQFCLHLCYLEYLETSDDQAVVYSIRFLPAFFSQYPAESLMANQPFRFDQTTEQQFSVCAQARTLLAQLTQDVTATSPLIRSLHRMEAATHLLRRALECITAPFTTCQVPACRFLAYEGERDKIAMAMEIIGQNTDQPHTIRELSRKVAMNECYLKKGFKAITGKTIHEYQQELRIARAKTLLQQQGVSVTDVANILGYSSISHFSTAFKKVTGMKPCELLA